MDRPPEIGGTPSELYPMPPRKRHTLRWVLAGLGALIVAGIIAAVASNTDGQKTTGRAVTSPPTSPTAPATSAASTTAEPATSSAYAVPTKSDFRITLKILSKDCFGDAGCNVTYRPQLAQIAGGELDPTTTYDITYEVRGGDDGAQVDTLELTGGQYQSGEGVASTASAGVKLTAVITSVDAQ